MWMQIKAWLALIGGLCLTGCANINRDFIAQYQTDNFSVHNKVDPLEIKHDKMMQRLLTLAFNHDQAAQTDFINHQNDPTTWPTLQKQLRSLSDPMAINQLLSQNWYVVLNHIDQFNYRFGEWYTLPKQTNVLTGESVKMSDQYYERLTTAQKYASFRFGDRYFDDLKQSETSMLNEAYSDLFLIKNKALFNIKIAPNNEVTLTNQIYYFGAAQNQISVALLSNVFHNGIIHQSQKSYDMFEHDLVDRLQYGLAALMTMEVI